MNHYPTITFDDGARGEQRFTLHVESGKVELTGEEFYRLLEMFASPMVNPLPK